MNDLLTEEIEMELDGETVKLRPTVKAGLALSDEFGGLAPVSRGLQDINIGTMAAVLRIALDARPQDLPRIREKIVRTGALKVVPHCYTFLGALTGGQQDDEEEQSGNAE